MSADDDTRGREVLEENEEGYEVCEGEEEDEQEYVSWVAAEESHFRLKPLVIGLVVLCVVGVGAIVFATALTDPADKFDSAPILQDPSAQKTALSATGEGDRAFEAKMPEDRPRVVRAVDAPEAAEPDPSAPEAAAAPPEAVAVEPAPEPAVETESPAVEQAPVAVQSGYPEVLDQANKERNRKKKRELLRRAIELNPSGDEALATLAMMLMERGKTRTEALDLATKAVEANPDNGLGWLVIGYVKQVIGKAAEARDAYRKCASCSGPKRYVRECRQLG
ncbi:MAG: hypothetical protein JRF63_09260 [Deltaproteobacteria bacterium]|nr:hypothetical protein [Deltaproteobacteria bacterium]